MARRAANWLAAFILAASVAVVSIVFAAPSPPSAPGTTSAKTRVMRLACVNGQWVTYVSKASRCRGARKKLFRLPAQGPIFACRQDRGGRGPLGRMRFVTSLGLCGTVAGRKETGFTLPAGTQTFFCASRRGGYLRSIKRRGRCKRSEFRVVLPGHSFPADPSPPEPGPPGSPPGQPASPPIAQDDSSSTSEIDARDLDLLANDSDPDGGPLTVASLDTTGTLGAVTITGGGARVRYDPAGEFAGLGPGDTATDTFRYRASDGSADSNVATVTVTVGGVTNAPPVVDTTNTSLTYTENDPATAVDPGVTVADADAHSLTGASAEITNGAAGGDFLDWSDNNLADNVTLDTLNTGTRRIVLTGVDSAANYEAALRAVTFVNNTDNPTVASRTVTFGVTDLAGGTGSAARDIAVTAVGDPPLAVDDSASVLEDASATAIPVLTNDTDPDGGPKTISSASDPANGTVVLTGGSPGAHTGLTYQPDPNYCNTPPGTTPDTFNYTLNGGDSATVSVSVTCVNDAPVADDETFNGNDSAHGNTTLQVDDPDDNKAAPTNPHTEISGDILAGDSDIDGPGPLSVAPGTFASNDGGSVTIEADGDFTFQPAASASCSDTSDFFDYTVRDGGSPELTDVGRVTIAIAGCVWYVSNNAAGNSGTSSQPFDTLAQAQTASGNNHTVFVFDGDNTTTGLNAGFSMKAGQRLIGEHEGLVVDPDQGSALTADTLHPANAGALPTLTDNNADVVELDDGNEVRGFNIDPQGTGGGIAGAVGDTGGGTVDDVNINDAGTAGTQPGLELDGTTGTFSVSNLDVDTNGATGVRLVNAGAVNFASAGTISITTSGAKGLEATNTGMGTSAFDDITVTNSGSGGVSMSNTSGTTKLGDSSGTDLSLTTTSGSTPALLLASAGSVLIETGGGDDVRATGGPAVDVTGSANPTLEFDDVDSTNSAGDGINLGGLGTGTFSSSSGTISGAAGISFDLDDGSGAITYPGDLNNGAGQAAEITGRDGGAVSLSGVIGDTNDAGGGILVSGNNGGSTTFSNSSKTINTTISAGGGSPLNNAVVMEASDGHTLTLSGGGLDIDTTTGKGLEAVTSGTLNVTDPDPASGPANTIVTTTGGRALNVINTDVGATPLTFQEISSNGAPAGIQLSNTGANNALTVTGSPNVNPCTVSSSSACTGGRIQATTGADDSSATPAGTGIVLNNTRGISLTRMGLANHPNYGIRGTDVVGFALADSVIDGTNGTNATGGFQDSSVRFTNLTGNAPISNTRISGGFADNLGVYNTSGTLDRLTLTTVTIGGNSTVGGNDGVSIEGAGSAVVNATVQGSTFTSSRGDLFQFNQPGTGNGDLDFNGNTLSNNHPAIGTGGGGVTIGSGSSNNTRIDITNNSSRDAVGHAWLIVKDVGSGSLVGTFASNSVGVAATPNSGSLEGAGLKVQQAGQGTLTMGITNNTIRQYNNEGILVQAGAGIAHPGNLNTTITGNIVANPGNNAAIANIFQGIHLNSGTAVGDTFAVCWDAKTNTAAGSGRNGGVDMRARARQSTTVRLPGYAGPAADNTAVATFISGQNSGATASALADSTVANDFTGGGACTQP